MTDLVDRGAALVVGDLASAPQTRHLADQVNQLGRMDAVIHNAGVYGDRDRNPSPEGHPRVLAVNTLAPYLLTGLIHTPDRLIYLTSDMHVAGDDSLNDLDWTTRRWNGTQAYCDSKLFVTALALAIARRWPDVITHAVDPGWVPTRMGGPSATDDLEQGHLTQTWLAVDDSSDATRGRGAISHKAPLARLRWFTSFANPAITVDRIFSDTFAGIAPVSVPAFVVAQLAGGVAAFGLIRVLRSSNSMTGGGNRSCCRS